MAAANGAGALPAGSGQNDDNTQDATPVEKQIEVIIPAKTIVTGGPASVVDISVSDKPHSGAAHKSDHVTPVISHTPACSIDVPAHEIAPNKRSLSEQDKPEDSLSAHGASSDAEMERLRAKHKVKRMQSALARAELEEAQAYEEVAESQAVASSGSNRSRSDHGVPAHKGLSQN